jgi:hypothetical protein
MHTASGMQQRISPPSIGVFDSGVSGLSILRALRILLPYTHFVYLSDAGHAPYGERCDAYVLEHSRQLAHHHLFEGMDWVHPFDRDGGRAVRLPMTAKLFSGHTGAIVSCSP